MTTILYIEDSPVAQRIVERILQTHYTVMLASDGVEAVQKGRDIKPDLVLTDLNMPGLDGYEVATSLKAVWPNTPIVALTGEKTEEARRMALIAGCDGWLTKPISPQVLLKAVGNYLAGYVETLPDSPELAQEKLAYQQRLVTRLEKQVLELTAVHKITQAITETLNLDKIIDSTLAQLVNVIYADYLAIFLYNAKNKTLTAGGQRDFPSDYLDLISQSYQPDQTSNTIVKAIETGEPQIITDFSAYATNQSPELMAYASQIKSIISIPLMVSDRTDSNKIVGILQVATQKPREFDGLQTTLDLIGRQLAIAIDKARTHTDLQNAYQRLRELDELRNRFIMIASHELRTPLTILMGYTFLLEKEVTGMSKDIVNTIVEQSNSLNAIIDRILDVERLQHNDYLAEFTEVDLSQLVQKIVDNMNLLASDKQLTLSFTPIEPSPMVWVDPHKFETILINLIQNAIQFTPANKTIEVKIVVSPPIFEVAIQDNGIGIDSDEQKRIFEKFYQVQEPLNRDHGGVGLGLTIAQDMASVCGGRISLESEPGQGSTFTYHQPIKVETAITGE